MIPFLEITVGRRTRDGARIVAALERSPGEIPLCFEAPYELDPAALLAATDARVYGELLGAGVFVGEIHEAWSMALGAADRQRVRLVIEEPELQALRWERLCAPRDGDWVPMGLDQRCLFSIFQPSRAAMPFRPLGPGDLSAVVMVACPTDLGEYGLEPFDTAAAVSSVTDAMKESGIPFTVLSHDPSSAGPPTLDSLCSVITVQAPSLLHVIGHGKVRPRDGESVLYLGNDQNKVDAVTGTRFIERLALVAGERGLPQCMFLCTCESASPDEAATFGNLAQRLAQNLAIPAIVAMADRISVQTGLELGRYFYRGLRAHGEVDRAVSEAAATLAEHADALVPVVYSRLGSRPLFSADPDRPLTASERAYGLARVRSLVLARAPADEPEWNTLEQQMAAWAHIEQELLPLADKKRLLQVLTDIDRLTHEVAGTSFTLLCRGQQPEPYDNRCPFLGLQAFSEQESAFFFGREPLVEQVTDMVLSHRVAFVVGPSGSGKSSVVLGGVVPLLRKRFPEIAARRMTPGATPLETLTRILEHSEPSSLIVIDQFEELFTMCDDPEQRYRFVEQVRKHNDRISFIMTLRADYVGDCTQLAWVKTILQHHWVLAAPMGALELRGAIERQAAAVGLRFEPGVCARIMEQIADQPGAMPLVQHALLELYRRRRGRLLRLSAFEATGGVFLAITQTAERIFQAANHKEQEWLRAIFLRLVRLDTDLGPDEADRRRGTRARVGIEELCPRGLDMGTLRGMLLRLTDARLVVTSRESRADGEGHLDADRVEVAHEAVLRHWPRLEEWIRADREALLARQEAERLAAEWQQYQEDSGLLVRPGRKLDDLLPLCNHPRITLTPLARRFLLASDALKQSQEQARRAQIRRKRMLIGGAVGALAVVSVAMALLWSGAEENRRREAIARQSAQVNATAAQAAQQAAETAKGAAVRAEQLATEQARAAAFAASLASVATVADKDPLTASLLLGETIRIDPNRQPRAGWAEAFELLQKPVPKVALRAESPVAAMAFTNDSKSLFALHDSGQLSLSDVEQGRIVNYFGQRGADSTVAFSPDGQWAAVARCEDTVQLWNTATGQAGPVLQSQGRACQAMFSEDGSLVVTYGGSGEVGVWESQTGNRVGRFNDLTTVSQVRVHAGQGVLVTVGSEVRVWDLSLQQVRYTEPIQRDLTPDVALAFSGRFLLVVWPRRSLRIVWTENGKIHGGFENQGPVSVRAVDVAHDGRSVLMIADSEVSLWKTDEVFGLIPVGAPVRRVRNDTEVEWVKTALFSPDGRWILAQLNGGVGVVARGETGEVVWRLESVRGDVRFGANGRVLMAQTEWLRIWDLEVGKKIAEFRAGAHRGALAALSHDGSQVATVVSDGGIGIWSVAHEIDALVMQPQSDPTLLGFSEDGQRVFAATSGVELWRTEGGASVGTLAPLKGGVRGVLADPRTSWMLMYGDEAVVYRRDGTPQGRVAGWDATWGAPVVGPDGRSFIAVGHNGVRVWSDEGTLLRDVVVGNGRDGTIRGAWLLPDGRSVLVLQRLPAGNLKLTVMSGSDTTSVRDLTPENPMRSVTVDPGGIWALIALEGGGAEVVMTTGDGVVELGLETPIVAAAFSTAGDLLLTASDNGVLRVWEVGTWNIRAAIRQTGDRIEKVGFSRDGSWCWSLTKSMGDGEKEGGAGGKRLSIYRTTDTLTVAVFDLTIKDEAAPAFSDDGKHMAMVKDGHVVVIPTTWKDLVDKVRERTRSCLTPNQRVVWLGEDPTSATQRANECEQQ
ncbi:MAG: CHAT domain-containing protein [Myxococcales bacterium]|nr:CHAT domain-containing protein [Myxococcales bacterium]